MESSQPAPRRRHSAQLKSLVLAQCTQPGTSVAQVAMAHGLNANLVHKWRRIAAAASLPAAAQEHSQAASAGFIALTMPARSAAPAPPPLQISIKLRRGNTAMAITWPVAAATDCAAWVREVLQ